MNLDLKVRKNPGVLPILFSSPLHLLMLILMLMLMLMVTIRKVKVCSLTPL